MGEPHGESPRFFPIRLGEVSRMTRVKVLLVNTSYPPFVIGGAELSVKELAEDLAAAGHDVRVLCLAPRSQRQAVLPSTDSPREGRGVTVHRLWRRRLHVDGRHPAWWARALWHLGELVRVREYAALRAEIRRGNPDIVHFNNIAGFGWLAWLAARDIPSVQTLRDYSLVCTSSFGEHDHAVCSRRSLRCRILKSPFVLPRIRPTRIVGVSEYVVERMTSADVRGKDATPSVVRNRPHVAARVDRPATAGRASNTPPVVGFLGRLDADKGVGVLHEAVRRMRESGTAATLVVAGAPTPYGRELQKAYDAEYTEGVFRQIGYLDASSLFARCDVLAVPTQWQEPFGRVAAEGLQSGTPVVASHVGGLPELRDVYGGGIRTVLRYRDPDAWAVALASGSDPAVRHDALSDAPRPADAYLTIYDEVRQRSSAAGSVVGSAHVKARQS
jgi:glycosyltransferase involved in cell wall biosynthesis